MFIDLTDARTRIGLFMDYYNFQRSHQSLDGLVPADRFFGAAVDVRRTLDERVAANALELARQGVPKTPFYMTGQVAGQAFSVRTWFIVAAVTVGACAMLRGSAGATGVLPAVGLIAGMILVWSLLLGPQFLRQDFRQDLGHGCHPFPVPAATRQGFDQRSRSRT